MLAAFTAARSEMGEAGGLAGIAGNAGIAGIAGIAGAPAHARWHGREKAVCGVGAACTPQGRPACTPRALAYCPVPPPSCSPAAAQPRPPSWTTLSSPGGRAHPQRPALRSGGSAAQRQRAAIGGGRMQSSAPPPACTDATTTPTRAVAMAPARAVRITGWSRTAGARSGGRQGTCGASPPPPFKPLPWAPA